MIVAFVPLATLVILIVLAGVAVSINRILASAHSGTTQTPSINEPTSIPPCSTVISNCSPFVVVPISTPFMNTSEGSTAGQLGTIIVSLPPLGIVPLSIGSPFAYSTIYEASSHVGGGGIGAMLTGTSQRPCEGISKRNSAKYPTKLSNSESVLNVPVGSSLINISSIP